MAVVGHAVERILIKGTTYGLTTEIYSGKIPQQATYPAIEIDDFSSSEACKDGEGREYYTVTLLIWGDYKADLDDIADACKMDLINFRSSVVNTDIKGVRFDGRQPWIWNKDIKKWLRPIEFQISI